MCEVVGPVNIMKWWGGSVQLKGALSAAHRFPSQAILLPRPPPSGRRRGRKRGVCVLLKFYYVPSISPSCDHFKICMSSEHVYSSPFDHAQAVHISVCWSAFSSMDNLIAAAAQI